jgi:hypothetical protein
MLGIKYGFKFHFPMRNLRFVIAYFCVKSTLPEHSPDDSIVRPHNFAVNTMNTTCNLK